MWLLMLLVSLRLVAETVLQHLDVWLLLLVLTRNLHDGLPDQLSHRLCG
jgi:hypothetical protein